MDDQLLREFLAEADERLEVLFADIERLRRVHTSADGRVRRELVARIFRHVHTLKGSAATLPRLAPVAALAHELENLLDAVRSGRAPLSDALVDACEDATAALSGALEAVARGDALPAIPPAVFTQLRRHAGATRAQVRARATETRQSNVAAVAALPEEIARAITAPEQRHLNESLKEGARAMLLAVVFDLSTLDEHFSRFTAALGGCGEIISTFPGDPATAPDDISFRILYTTLAPRHELESRIAPFGAQIAWTDDAPQADDAHRVIAEAASSLEDGDPANASPESVQVAQGEPARTPHFVRVPLRELDELVTATHELFTDTLALLEGLPASGDVPLATDAQATPHAHLPSTHDERSRLLRESFTALEERVMSLRMQPLMPVLERAARGARIAARAAGKEIELEVAGGEVRVDRSLAEQVGEPLLHLLRNAIDHGIETADERRAAGKPERGRVRLEVAAEGSRVRVRVADDGRGIDAERVARVAVQQGLLEAGAQISEEQALRLIFRPGFSTAGSVSEVSGRGVGLDVVEHALERAGGDLRVRSERGAGTTFELRVPLALALVGVVVVGARDHAYAIDASHVVASAYFKPEDIARDEAGQTALWQGKRLRLVSLPSLLGGAATAESYDAVTRLPAVVVRRARQDADAWRGATASAADEFVIAVDEIQGEREVLVRSLGRHATRWRGVSGAFTERDGSVALLLDLPRLLERGRTR